MALTCQTCGEELPYDPDYAIEEGNLECIVEFSYQPEGIAVKETEFYCDPECFTEKYD